MRFPLADWIDAHPGCRFDLATSGMKGSIRAPTLPRSWPDRTVLDELRGELAAYLGVAPERTHLAHGASEANAWILGYLARRPARGARRRRARVRFPEYPPLFEGAEAQGLPVAADRRPAEVAVVSRPRNPGGELWTVDELHRFSDGARELLVDETFREFAGVPSVAAAGTPRLWATGTFTKFFGADGVRVGWAVAPPEATEAFARYVGVVSDEVAPWSAATALGLLRDVAAVRRSVQAVIGPNLRALARLRPDLGAPRAPVCFDRSGRQDGRQLADRCLRASVLVCPGSFFGAPRGVRLCLTRRNFPAGLRAYLGVRRTEGSPA